MNRIVRAVLFDFVGTLFDDTSVLSGARLSARCAGRGVRLSAARAAALCTAIQSAVGSPAGQATLRGADRDAGRHRRLWTALAESVPGVGPAVAAAFYDCVTDVRAWRPYPDTAATLGALRRSGVPVAVVSNIGWDIRGSFRHAGLAGLVDTFVLSCDHGVEKPHPLLFEICNFTDNAVTVVVMPLFHIAGSAWGLVGLAQGCVNILHREIACRRLGVSPPDALMVGDDPVKDGGAAAVGVPVYVLPTDRAGDRSRGLDAVLRLVGVSGWSERSA